MDMQADQPSVILTGAAGGMGRAMTIGLLQAGWRVLAVDREGAALDALRAEVSASPSAGAHPARFASLGIDLTRDDSAARVVDAALESFGPITALINNAGINMMSHHASRVSLRPRFWEVPAADFRLFTEVNAIVPLRLGAAVVPHMLAQAHGRIITVTTSLGSMLRAGMHPYGPSKAASEALAAIMAEELQGSGITVNVVVPGGPVDTPMVGDDPPIPRERFLQPEVMLPPLLWLLSDAAAEVTGQRYIARLWDVRLPPEAAAARAGAPVAWHGVAGEQWIPR